MNMDDGKIIRVSITRYQYMITGMIIVSVAVVSSVKSKVRRLRKMACSGQRGIHLER